MNGEDIGVLNIIGKKIAVLNHPNESIIGLKGYVIYESSNLVHVKLLDKDKIVKIPKKGLKIKILDNSEKVITYKELKGNIVRRLIRI